MIRTFFIAVHAQSAVETGRQVADVIADTGQTGRQVIDFLVILYRLLIEKRRSVVRGLLNAFRLRIQCIQQQCQIVEFLLDAYALYSNIAAGVSRLLLVSDIL